MDQIVKTWQQEFAEGFSNARSLCNYLNIPLDTPDILSGTPDFAVRVPKEFVDRMEPRNPHDPLLKQVLPLYQENIDYPGFTDDPVGDIAAATSSGVIHKYQGRALFITTGACAINCRYCFRRNFPYSDYQISTQKQLEAIEYIKCQQDISEIILSGGDPLLLNDKKLFDLIHQLDKIPHLKRIRIHSRIPIVLPSRISTDFCQHLSTITKPIVLVVHSNHTKELNQKVNQACNKLKQTGVSLLNQSVLLKDINDNAEQLSALSEKLFDFGILPYYLHLLDKAAGTGHFEVPQNQALNLMSQIKKQLPGYLVPKLVREQAGASHKINIA